jgi:hypothetical protein
MGKGTVAPPRCSRWLLLEVRVEFPSTAQAGWIVSAILPTRLARLGRQTLSCISFLVRRVADAG